MKNKIILLCGMVFIVMGLTGCQSGEYKELLKENAPEAALKYIKEKYDMRAEVIDTKLSLNEGLFGDVADEFVTVVMEVDGKVFNVLINGELDEEAAIASAMDDYQADEIEEALKNSILNVLEIDEEEINYFDSTVMSLNKDEAGNKIMAHEFYNGENLVEVLNSSENTGTIYTNIQVVTDKEIRKTDLKSLSTMVGNIVKLEVIETDYTNEFTDDYYYSRVYMLDELNIINRVHRIIECELTTEEIYSDSNDSAIVYALGKDVEVEVYEESLDREKEEFNNETTVVITDFLSEPFVVTTDKSDVFVQFEMPQISKEYYSIDVAYMNLDGEGKLHIVSSVEMYNDTIMITEYDVNEMLVVLVGRDRLEEENK